MGMVPGNYLSIVQPLLEEEEEESEVGVAITNY